MMLFLFPFYSSINLSPNISHHCTVSLISLICVPAFCQSGFKTSQAAYWKNSDAKFPQAICHFRSVPTLPHFLFHLLPSPAVPGCDLTDRRRLANVRRTLPVAAISPANNAQLVISPLCCDNDELTMKTEQTLS